MLIEYFILLFYYLILLHINIIYYLQLIVNNICYFKSTFGNKYIIASITPLKNTFY